MRMRRFRRFRRCTVTIAMVALASSFAVTPSYAALTLDWQRSAGVELQSVAHRGFVVAVGSIDLPDVRHPALLVRRYEQNGDVTWTKTWHPQGTRVNGLDVAIDQDGAIYVVGDVARSNLEGGGFFLRKYSPAGELRWSRVSRGGYVTGPDVPEIATGVSVYRRNVIVVGHHYGCCGSAADDGWIRSFRPNGSSRWTRDFEVPDVPRATNDVALEVATNASGIYVVGHVEDRRRDDLSVRVDTELVAQKLTFAGARRWTFMLRDRDVKDQDEGTDIAVGHGSVFVAGDVNGKRFGQGEGVLARLTPTGVVDWRRIWGEPADGIAPSGVGVTGAGDAVVTGRISDPDDDTLDVFVRHIGSDGALIEQVIDDRVRSIASTALAAGPTSVYVSGWAELASEEHAGRLWRWSI